MVEPLRESTRTLLDHIQHATSVLGAVLFVLAVYAITRCLSVASATYRKLLIFVTVVSELNDAYLMILLHPVYLFPVPCWSIDGLLATHTNLPSSLCFEVWVSSLSFLIIPYGMCFVYRNQVSGSILRARQNIFSILLPPNHRFRMSTFKSTFLLSVWSFTYMLNGLLFEYVYERSSIARKRILEGLSDEWPAPIRTHALCIVASRTFVICGGLTFSVAVTVFLIYLISMHTFYTLNRLQMISERTRAIHRRLTKSLIAQATIPTVNILLPQVALVIQLSVGFDVPAFAPLMVFIIGTHTIVHSITVVFGTDLVVNCIAKKITSGTADIQRR